MRKFVIISFLLALPFLAAGQENYHFAVNKYTYMGDTAHVYVPENYVDNVTTSTSTAPKNVIFFIGDGMGATQIFAALSANHGNLYLQQLTNIGFIRTHSASDYITDSAAGGTALSCGQKTTNGMIGMAPDTTEIPSILELCKNVQHMSTGIVATSSIVHATPAAFIAHVDNRTKYEDIALEFLGAEADVFIGGGQTFFKNRKDKRNLYDELGKIGYRIYESMDAAHNDNDLRLGILLSPEHMPVADKRTPKLREQTQKAIDVLSNKNTNGFFLFVEGSQIDWGGHQNDTHRIVTELLDFDQAIGAALKFAAADGNTLIVVTADHETGGLTILGGDIDSGTVEGSFSTGEHSAVMVPVFAFGPGSENFRGIYDNTEIFHKMANLLGIWK